jgi:IclR family KDG regulon transcriptional repressor
MDEQTTGIQTIQKAAKILRAFKPNSPEIGVRELAQKLDIPKSTVHRILMALEQEGFVQKNINTDRYHLGLELIAIAGIALRNLDVRRVALPVMNRLAERWKETIDLDVLQGTHIIIIEQIAGQHILSTGGTLASRMPAHCTSTGKILLAYAGPQYVQEHYSEEIPKLTRYSIGTRTRLLEELENIRQQGYARAWGENEEYVHALAVPIRDRTDEVVAAISISGLAARINETTAEEMIKDLKEATTDISKGLGYVDISAFPRLKDPSGTPGNR